MSHLCPGCSRPGVPDQMFACKGCWPRLPLALRNPILLFNRRDPERHLRAMTEARRWYRDNLGQRVKPQGGR